MRLCDVSKGEQVIIQSLDFEPIYAKRLRDLGFCEGESVKCVRKALMSSPILYYTKGSYIALRKRDAKRIGVTYEQ